MKTTILTLFASLLVGFSYGQCTYEFKINGASYQASEQLLNDTFGKAFEQMKAERSVKDKNFELWLGTYSIFKAMSCSNAFTWDLYYNKLVNMKYEGRASNRDLGLADNGSKATGNPNKKENLGRRMAILNYIMTKYLTNHFLNTTL
ncbi:hypothetical protein [Pedobacter miscanthi]|uniref:hypothetical protein n=1 Tax=Pedobacter miscanthi TaxID=2259170 RepID=UPI00293077AB|nr:hypothetical protein [Pedobacter miscanthi]